MKSQTWLLATVAIFLTFLSGCSRPVGIDVFNRYPFPISVYGREYSRNMSWPMQYHKIAPQNLLSINGYHGESVHLLVSDAQGKLLRQVTVGGAMTQTAYEKHETILVEVGAGQNKVSLERPAPDDPINNWHTCGILLAVMAGVLIAFRYWQRRM